MTELRYAKFMQMLGTRATVEPSDLPPTKRAAYYHSLRVHLQVAQWKNLDLRCLNADEWGWKFENGHLTPIKIDLDAAPEFLLNFIRCNCRLTSKNVCGTQRCSCRKHGLKCVAACGDCRGKECNNMANVDNVEPSDDEEFDMNIFYIFN